MRNRDNNKRTRAEINRENAQKSTGPRTEEGKKTASLNALRHGLNSQVVVMPYEDLQAYKQFVAEFHDDLKPKGKLEQQIAQSIADQQWQLNRARAMESHVLALAFDDRSEKTITDFSQTHAAIATAIGLTKKLPDLNTLSLHQQRLSRALNRDITQFRKVQAERKEAERKALDQAARILLLHKREYPAPTQEADGAQLQAPQYCPSNDGFVFSTAEIELHIAREDRRRRALAYEIECRANA